MSFVDVGGKFQLLRTMEKGRVGAASIRDVANSIFDAGPPTPPPKSLQVKTLLRAHAQLYGFGGSPFVNAITIAESLPVKFRPGLVSIIQ